MQTVLSISQGILGILFALAGLAKFALPTHQLGKIMHWTAHYPESSVRFIAISEIFGGVGLLAPWAAGSLSQVAAFTAFGVASLLLLAFFHHLERGEKLPMLFVSLLLVMAAFVVWGNLG